LRRSTEAHSTALVSVDTWEYNSPRLKASGKSSDLRLLAMAQVYYDTIILEVQNAQQLQDLVVWASTTGHDGQLLSMDTHRSSIDRV
jgi:hypothetical protein